VKPLTTASIPIDEAQVRALVAEQFPRWAHWPVRKLPQSGWDNITFKIGKKLIARLPSAAAYEAQVQREQMWLPLLRPHLPLPIPEPLARGRPGCGYPWAWSVYRWLPGQSAAQRRPNDDSVFAHDLAAFLNALRAAPAAGGPLPGPENFYRGASLTAYGAQFRAAMLILEGQIDTLAGIKAWDTAVNSSWGSGPVWVHGDIALGNLLVRQGRLAAVIDFGQLVVGDPACDLAIAWTYFRAEQRQVFRSQLALDEATWQRGRAWALWKAAIVAAKLTETNAVEGQSCWQTLDEVLVEAARGW
jgi:aminoglycoside phosphotransferase (APT) family kinase protein